MKEKKYYFHETAVIDEGCLIGKNTKIYKDVINGKGYGLNDAKQATEIVHHIRNSEPIGLKGEYHPFAKIPLVNHPFKK